jgi:hypothetical protein
MAPLIADLTGPVSDAKKQPSDMSARGVRIDPGRLDVADIGISPLPFSSVRSQNQGDPE